MTCATRVAFAILAAALLGSVSRTARAEPPSGKAVAVYVLSIWTDDADDQADALTQALRSRVRQAQGWSLLETSQSFETLAIALRCPAKPDGPCLQRIGDQLHADHYVWGTMAKKKTPGEVSADMHLWSRGKGDTDASEAYSENLKDASDESLKQIAARLFARLIGVTAGGTVVIHAGTASGWVTVDGVDKGQLERGAARVDVGVGEHSIGVRVPGFEATAQRTNVAIGGEQDLTFVLSPTVGAETARSSFPLHKVVGYSALVVGAGLLVAAGVEGIAWLNDKSASKNDRNSVPSSVTDVCTTEVNGSALDACHRSKDALSASTAGWVFAGIGAAAVVTGVAFLVTDHDASDSPRAATVTRPSKPQVDVLPVAGARGGALDLRVTF